MGNGKRTDAGFYLAHGKEMITSGKYMVIYRHKDKYSISEMCQFLSIPKWILWVCVSNGCAGMGSAVGGENTRMSGCVWQDLRLPQSSYMA